MQNYSPYCSLFCDESNSTIFLFCYSVKNVGTWKVGQELTERTRCSYAPWSSMFWTMDGLGSFRRPLKSLYKWLLQTSTGFWCEFSLPVMSISLQWFFKNNGTHAFLLKSCTKMSLALSNFGTVWSLFYPVSWSVCASSKLIFFCENMYVLYILTALQNLTCENQKIIAFSFEY